MAVTYRQGLSILELIVYIPTLVMSLVVAWRHGFNRRAGWYFYILFSLARLVGNGCYLGTINDPDNENLYIAYGVCNSVGLAPLTLGVLAALSRVNDSIQRNAGSGYWSAIFRIAGLPSFIGMILSIVGMTTSSSLEAGLTSKLTKAGMILYLVGWAIVVAVTFLIWAQYRSIEKGEHRLVLAATFSMPFLTVRLVYSALAIFKHTATFNMFTGNTTVFLVMDILEEIVIVYVMVLTGLTLDIRAQPIPDQPKESFGAADIELESAQGQRLQNGNYAPPSTQYEKYPYKGGPIQRLITWIIHEINERRAR
ncbi:hypothetical protein UA08_01054 [Talaromyces atroroseus]|uniref:DUF7702 domain-containing protein n=1 Tax=Talaromyces atroroseus TaxID=1441469 RepID=A0A225BCN3_TALAT|nr:hypothetical protein UA08_01054 [Talaromyces atroroseus]OKL64685.1 hypothetical protein UA08_01054 [Talaromyces atroroseus]